MRQAILESSVEITTSDLGLWYDASQLRSYSGSGTSWNDVSGLSNNGVLTGGPTFSSTNGGSIVFDGTNDFIALPASNAIIPSPTTGATIECWARSTSSSAARLVNTSRDGGGNLSMAFFFNSGAVGSLQLQYRNSTNSTNIVLFVGGTYNNGNWFHVVGTASTTTGGILYINGSQVASDATAFRNLIGSFRSTIGCNPTATADFFNGDVSIARIYRRSITSAEVLQNFNAEKSRFGL